MHILRVSRPASATERGFAFYETLETPFFLVYCQPNGICKPFQEKTNCKYHFFEHLELFFLSRDMLFQSSRLASITIRISQLAKMEEYRQLLAEKCFRENFISYLKENEMHNELDQYENNQNNFNNFNSTLLPTISSNYITWQGFQNVHFDCDVKMKLENASFLQRNNPNPLRQFDAEYKLGFQTDAH